MLLDEQRADLDGMLEKSVCEHGAQDAMHLVIKGGQAHLPRLDCLQEVVTKELCAGHLLV